jgi:[NiFe] hydrogenase diaphorase moiety small subunit
MADKKKKNQKPVKKKAKISGKIEVKKTALVKSKTAGKSNVKKQIKRKDIKKAVGASVKSNVKSKKKIVEQAVSKAKNTSPKKVAVKRTGKKLPAAKAAKPKVRFAAKASKKTAAKPKIINKLNKKAAPAKKDKPSPNVSVKSTKIFFSIDGVDCTAMTGQSIVEAAKDNGIYIPVLCSYEGMKPAGICRMCTVKVGGRFMAACTTPVAEGMIIENSIPEIENMRKALIEMLFVEGNHMCPTCEKSGNCDLQALGYRYQMIVPRFPYQFPGRKIDASYTKIMIDNNRCVHCRRCVRDIITKDGKHIFAMTNRSGKSTIIADHELEAGMSDELASKAMYQCPVGAILKKEVGFSVPIGKRKYDKAPIGSEIQK